MSDWVKALGIDFGTVRIGLAGSDDLGFLAHPLETVSASPLEKALQRLLEVVRTREVLDVVVGLPLHVDGREGERVLQVREFMGQLREILPDGIRYHEVDERYSTLVAREKLGRSRRKGRQVIEVVDQAAAAEILQAWLDARG